MTGRSVVWVGGGGGVGSVQEGGGVIAVTTPAVSVTSPLPPLFNRRHDPRGECHVPVPPAA